MTTAPALLPCPNRLCGVHDARVAVTHSAFMSDWRVQCLRCGCHGPRHNDKAQAIAAWNARPSGDEAAIAEAIQALIDAGDYFSARADVNDGDYGVPSPNREMTLASQCDEALERLEALRARAQMEMGE